MVTKLLYQMKLPTLVSGCAIILLLIYTSNSHAELIFSAPPREDAKKEYETYGPLVNYLSYVIGERVVYEHPDGWAEYANNMRNGHYDIVFDGPHFSAWRMKHISHIPVARLPGSLGFVVVARKQGNRTIHKIKDLLALKVCALASPNLGTVTFYNLLANPVYQPRLYEVKGGFAKVFEALKEGKCDAAVLRDSFYYNMDPREKQNLTVVTASKPFPNQTITVGQRLHKKKDIIAQKLVSSEGKQAAAALLRRFGANQESLWLTDSGEFENLDSLLTGVVFGW
ncbi:MAG: phosphate/phosphite/phosphonate ABC transporter substrate-binding protein [Gammaproteobacteria bacterium]|nr:phosphate/phosphite/phosphonate ABC transporter substrate-binding protein [Gammaproteobacteria bacterium]